MFSAADIVANERRRSILALRFFASGHGNFGRRDFQLAGALLRLGRIVGHRGNHERIFAALVVAPEKIRPNKVGGHVVTLSENSINVSEFPLKEEFIALDDNLTKLGLRKKGRREP